MKRIIAVGAVALALFAVQAAWAQKPSVIAKIEGAAYVVRACSTHDWVAAWSQKSDGTYDLYVVNGQKGTKRVIANEHYPGGMCWIPKTQKLLYCRGMKSDKVEFTHVTYYLYDLDSDTSTKLIDVNDMLSAYLLDPIASEDGSIVFHMTIAATRKGDIPSFNIYNTAANVMMPLPSEANIASDYDLSSDGTRLFWLLHDPDSGNLFIVGWDINKQKYSDMYEFGTKADPADDHALLKVQSPRNRAATLVTSESDDTLKLCVYDFKDVNNLFIQPLHLKASEDIVCFDWKGFSDSIYALIHNNDTGDYSIEEINVMTGARTSLLTSRDEISFVDYSGNSQSYYYAVVDTRNPKQITTSLIRLK